MLQGCALLPLVQSEVNLEIDFQSELKRPRIEGCCGLPCGTCSRNRIAERVDVTGIEAVQHVESVRDDLEVEAFRDWNRARNAKINLKKSGRAKALRPSVPVQP